MSKLLSLIVIGAIVISMVGCSSGENTNDSSEENVKQEQNQENTEQEQSSQDKESNKEEGKLTLRLSNGTFIVGQDLEPGRYLLGKNEGEFMGSYEITTDTTGDFESNVDSNAFENFTYIEVKEGQYVHLDKCTLYKVEEIKPYIHIEDLSELTNGMFVVGEDIKPGEYKLEAINGDQGWYCLYNNLAGGYKNGPDLQDADSFSGSKLITLKEGQYLKLDSKTKVVK